MKKTTFLAKMAVCFVLIAAMLCQTVVPVFAEAQPLYLKEIQISTGATAAEAKQWLIDNGYTVLGEDLNAGTGKEVSIKELTELVAKVVGYEGKILWDTTRPNGTPRKLLDVSKAERLGWKYRTELEDGIRLSYADFLNNPMRAER